MALAHLSRPWLAHLPGWSPAAVPAPPAPGAAPPPAAARHGVGARVPVVHRLGAVAVAAVILVFGLLGFAGGLAFFSTTGGPIAGLSSNGLLSTISVLTAAVLIAAAVRGPRIASTVMLVIGVLFLLSALLNLALLDGPYNLLAFRLPNVFFSVGAGLVLLLLGSYGRVSGHLPADSPYARARTDEVDDDAEQYPSTPEEFAAERSMRAAEIAVVQHVAPSTSAGGWPRWAGCAPAPSGAASGWSSTGRGPGTPDQLGRRGAGVSASRRPSRPDGEK